VQSSARTHRADESGADLSSDREPARDATIARAHGIESTVRYLGIEIDDAIEIAEKVEI
jgi:hypothetical protein